MILDKKKRDKQEFITLQIFEFWDKYHLKCSDVVERETEVPCVVVSKFQSPMEVGIVVRGH